MKLIQKTTMTVALAVLFTACGETGAVDIASSKVTRSVNTSSITNIQNNGVDYLNNLRSFAGMIPFQREMHLEDAANNHATYLINNNIFSHFESQNDTGFTGKVPSDRARFSSYANAMVGENISSSNKNVENSIDTLFSAIYHRFGFLNFAYDEVGIGFAQSDAYRYGNVYDYNMGISTAKAVTENRFQNPDFVIWPANGMDSIPPVFYEESPDPMPECSVSGYPMSISFNPLKSEAIMLDSFKLYDNNNQEIRDVKMMDKKSDPNHTFSETEFALFPKERLDWDSAYHVEIAYHDSEGSKKEVVDFKTASLPYPSFKVKNGGESFDVAVNQTRLFYLPPAHCNDTLTTFSATGLLSELAFYDANTIMITPKNVGKLEVTTSNGRNFTLNVK